MDFQIKEYVLTPENTWFKPLFQQENLDVTNFWIVIKGMINELNPTNLKLVAYTFIPFKSLIIEYTED